MASGESDRNVLVFDETKDQLYKGPICMGVAQAGREAWPFDDINFALEDFDSSVSALVTTLAPLHSRSERLDETPPAPSALIRRAIELDVPLAIISEHPAAKLLLRPNCNDAVFSSNIRERNNIPKKVAAWLGQLGVNGESILDLPEPAVTLSPEDERMEEVGAGMFGSTIRLRLGIWIANREVEDGDFYQLQVVNRLGLSQSAAHNHLIAFCRLGMLERDTLSSASVVYFIKQPSPLWEIFKVAEKALDELNAQNTE